MTQEELDALMAGDMDETNALELEEVIDEEEEEKEEKVQQEDEDKQEYEEYPPPSPTDDNKMVYQLDDVTKDSEVKAGEVFDKLESINNFLADAQDNATEVITLIDSNIELFDMLCKKFPNVEQFSKSLEDNKNMKEKVEALIGSAQSAEDEIMMTMDIMQYQDIHRQKIERVINVMRALSRYMSNLFEGKVDDKKRVSSAVHISGDKNTEDLVSNDDIEALIASLGEK